MDPEEPEAEVPADREVPADAARVAPAARVVDPAAKGADPADPAGPAGVVIPAPGRMTATVGSSSASLGGLAAWRRWSRVAVGSRSALWLLSATATAG